MTTQEKDKSLIISDTEMYKFDGKFYKGLVGGRYVPEDGNIQKG